MQRPHETLNDAILMTENTCTSLATESIERESPSLKQRLGVAGICVFLFLGVYVLSAGPMSWLHRIFEFREFDRALEVVYAPLLVLIDLHIEPFATILKWYINLFR